MVLQSVSNLFSITPEGLKAADGRLYPKLHENKFLDDLTFELGDYDWANTLYSAFQEHLLPTIPPEELESFNKAFIEACLVFGVRKEATYTAFARKLGKPDWFAKNEVAFNKFLHATHSSVSTPLNANRKVVIITTSTSGGNLSVAHALESHLKALGLEVSVLDHEDFAKEGDPLYKATGTATRDSIYKAAQQSNSVGFEFFKARDEICRSAGRYFPNQTMACAVRRIRELNPALIISTRNYCPLDFNYLRAGRKFCMVACDFEVAFPHQSLVGILPAECTFVLPELAPRFFAPFLSEKSTWETCLEELALKTGACSQELGRRFQLLGCPARAEFKVEDLSSILSLKTKWRLDPSTATVLVEIGANGVGLIEEIFDQIHQTKSPYQFVIVCGRNEELKQKLDQKLKANPQDCIKILGFVNALEKNELLNLCDLFFTKPGGATVFEVYALAKRTLMLHCHPHEQANLDFLQEKHLTTIYDQRQDLMPQIARALTLELPAYVQVNWRHNLQQLVSSLL